MRGQLCCPSSQLGTHISTTCTISSRAAQLPPIASSNSGTYRFIGAGERAGAIRFAQTVLLWRKRHWRFRVVRNSLCEGMPARLVRFWRVAKHCGWAGSAGRSEVRPSGARRRSTRARSGRVSSDRAERRAQACRTGPPPGECQNVGPRGRRGPSPAGPSLRSFERALPHGRCRRRWCGLQRWRADPGIQRCRPRKAGSRFGSPAE